MDLLEMLNKYSSLRWGDPDNPDDDDAVVYLCSDAAAEITRLHEELADATLRLKARQSVLDEVTTAAAELAVTAAMAEAKVVELGEDGQIKNPNHEPLTPADVLKSVIRSLALKCSHRRNPIPLWSAVSQATTHGSGYSIAICRWAGFDPDTGAAIDAAGDGE